MEETDDDVFRNTIQSMNERDNVNYLIESSNDNAHKIFKTSLNNLNDIGNNNMINNNYINNNSSKKNTIRGPELVNVNSNTKMNPHNKENSCNINSNGHCSQSNKIKDLILNDRDGIYIKSTEKLLLNLKSSIDYFSGVPSEFTVKNSDYKDVAVRMLKEELDKIKSDKEILMMENKKLKEKIKQMQKTNAMSSNLNNSSTLSKSNQIASSGVSYLEEGNIPVNKVVESFFKLQLKYDELEKENNYLKTENDDLNRKLSFTKKFVTENKERELTNKYSPFNKSRPIIKSQNNPVYANRKPNVMENLMKEQLKCMQKMLHLYQEEKSIGTIDVRHLYIFFYYIKITNIIIYLYIIKIYKAKSHPG